MGKVKVHGQLIEDRRTNGARIRLDTGDWIRIGVIATTVVLGIGSIKFTTDATAKLASENSLIINHNTQRIIRSEGEIGNLKEHILYIRSRVDEIAKALK